MFGQSGEVRYRKFTSVSEHLRVLADGAIATVHVWRNKVGPVRETRYQE
jgi:hypothetical protein